jgi:cell division protein FtsI (penicillin-binding protein 3)
MNPRARIILGVLLAVYGLIVLRAFHIQVLGIKGIRERGARQYGVKIPLLPKRGVIFDRTGTEFAVSLATKSIFVQPSKLSSPEIAAKVLSRRVSRPAAQLRKAFSSDRNFLWVKRQMPSSTAEEIVREVREALSRAGTKGGTNGIGTVEEPKRFYPNRELASSVIGFTDVDSVGIEGVELSLDKYLRGENAFLVYERDARGRIIVPADTPIEVNSQGHSVSLTIDRNIQHVAKTELTEAVKKYRARGGVALVMQPRTGEILAMASLPTFNPNSLSAARPEARKNRTITDVIEPGSTFKVFTLASALESGAIGVRDRIYCENGTYRCGGRTIHDTHKYEWLTVSEVIKFSSNIGMIKVSEKMDPGRYYDMIRAFGFGAKTGVELMGESRGLVPSRDEFSRIRRATISFGQGIAVTPLQLAYAMASVVNGGKMMKPYLVKEITDPEGRVVYRGEPKVLRRTISPKTSAQMREILGNVVQDDGTGTQARIKGFLVGGKTGTAQKVEVGTGRYSPDKRVASFVGFLPLDDPEFLILVVIDEPKGEVYGGVVAAPAFNQIAVKTAYYLGLTPTEPVGQDTATAAREETGTPGVRMTRVAMGPGESSLVMPDLRGLSMGRVVDLMDRYSVRLKLVGTGLARAQSPRPGGILVPGAACTVTFGTE